MSSDAIGFIGLGTLGGPIASNMLKSGLSLVVWNRTMEKAHALRETGAVVATDPADLFARAGTVVLMLSSEEAIDAVLGRGTERFPKLVDNHLVVNMVTTSPSYSHDLRHDLEAAGARYVEALVSGQKARAENRELTILLAGEPADVEKVRSLISTICSKAIGFGAVPAATTAKYALSVFQATMMVGLAEAVNYARQRGTDLDGFAKLLHASPLLSPLVAMQLSKFISGDFSTQGAIDTILTVATSMIEDNREFDIPLPVFEKSVEMYQMATRAGDGNSDATAVIKVFERWSSEGSELPSGQVGK